MKAFIDRIFKARREKSVTDKATEALVESMALEVKKPRHIDCECKECLERIKNAK
jgi:hypothetical protein